ncbi:hypothetical protein ACFLZW_07905 [Chloroflexota bacterium]
MKKHLLLLTILFLLTMSCSLFVPTADPTPQPSATAPLIVINTPRPTDIPPEPPTPTVEKTDPQPPNQTPDSLPTEALDDSPPEDPPLSEWKGIQIMPGAIAGKVSDDSSYYYTVDAAADEIVAFYKRVMSNNGWSLLGGTDPQETDYLVMLMFIKDVQVRTINIFTDRQPHGVMIIAP